MMFGNSAGRLAFAWSAHWFFATMLLIGIVLLIIWMSKNLPKKQLVNWIAILIVAGLIGSLLTMQAGMSGWRYMHGDGQWEEIVNP